MEKIMLAKSSGFTLIELLVAVAIIGILAGVAYPSYNDAVIKSRRAEAKAKLMEVAQSQERFYTENNRYASKLTEMTSYRTDKVKSKNGHYLVSVVDPGSGVAGTVAATSYTLTATPEGNQAKDKKCGSLTLTHTNVKGITGTGTAKDCW